MQTKSKTVMNILVFVVALLLIASVRGKTTATVSVDEECLTLTGPDGYSRAIDYDQIDPASVKLLNEEDLEDPGSAVTGGENRKYRWGQWENAVWGKYTLCVQRKIDAAVCFQTTDGETVIFNVESEDTTNAFADAFSEMVLYYQNEEATA